MNSTQFHYFMTVAKYESVTKAAEELYVSQPAVSRRISALEDELGVKLFEHVGRNIHLTDCGKEIYDLCCDYEEKLRGILEYHATATPSLKGDLSIAYVLNWDFLQVMSSLLDTFKEKYPGINLSFQSCGLKESFEGLRWEDFDAILTIDPELERYDKISWTEIMPLPRLLLYSKRHPVCLEKEAPSLLDFKDAVFFYPASEAVNTNKIISAICKDEGFAPTIVKENSWHTCLAKVLNGDGVLITDGWAPEVKDERFLSVPFSHSHMLKLAWRKSNKNPCIQVFKKELLYLLQDKA